MSITEKTFDEKSGVCIVCGMDITNIKPVLYELRDAVHAFCSNECLKEFLEDPEKYLYENDEDSED
ncbi:MAG: hypothetical protein ACD_76C00033G0001 [uncultured bacterium]|nr:MAG: hypothetical protein ACD_76C00033G0001 [uncultured bacterium]HBD04980.1 hypothetical protein [Candidatus Uhrbacteria bacterium]